MARYLLSLADGTVATSEEVININILFTVTMLLYISFTPSSVL